LLAYTHPTLRAYDAAFAFEIATIVREGFKRMFVDGEDAMYYLTVENENYAMPEMPEGVEEGILKGLYKFRAATKDGPKAHLIGSGPLVNAALEAQALLEENYGVAADVWSATSYKQLYRDATACERTAMMKPGSDTTPYVTQCLGADGDVVVASSDYMRTLPDTVARWVPKPMIALGTDGFGMSETRQALRDHFEVDGRFITLAALRLLAREGKIDAGLPDKAIQDLNIDTNKSDPILRGT
jgi:pyruvate dehydrogenase E1 component